MSQHKDEGINLANFDKEAEIAKFKGFKPTPWNVVVRLYIEPKSKGGLITPDSYHEEQNYQSCVGLVVGMGERTYTDARFDNIKWCEVGDWVAFGRHSGLKYTYDGCTVFVLREERIDIVADDPSKITR